MTEKITAFDIRGNDKHVEFMLQETKSPKVAGILKEVQNLESGKDRVLAIRLIEATLGVIKK